MPPDLQIYLLGTFRLLVKCAEVPNAAWQKRKAKLLVQILALHPARARFYRVLYAARRALEPERASYTQSNFLAGDEQKIKLAASSLWIDAEEFEQKARAGLKNGNQDLLESAAALYAGDLLADEPFEDWINDRRERLKILFHKVLHRLAENEERRQDFEKAHFFLDRILQIEPADETAHRAKMRLFCQAGERFRALRQYEKCVRVLRRELAVEPDEETRQLRQKIIDAGRD